jgi:hypothetical protein
MVTMIYVYTLLRLSITFTVARRPTNAVLASRKRPLNRKPYGSYPAYEAGMRGRNPAYKMEM